MEIQKTQKSQNRFEKRATELEDVKNLMIYCKYNNQYNVMLQNGQTYVQMELNRPKEWLINT